VQFAPNISLAQKSFCTHSVVLLGNDAQVHLNLVRLDIVVILMQDWCTICAKHTIGSEIILDAPGGTPR
jgi:hypothetical protein